VFLQPLQFERKLAVSELNSFQQKMSDRFAFNNVYIFPEYTFYEDRLKTYTNWPKQMIPNKHSLAKAGFYYTNIGDKETCFSCGITLFHWMTMDHPWDAHRKHSKDCIYINMFGDDTIQSESVLTSNHFGAVGQEIKITKPTSFQFGENIWT
jgi:hypothetical protein